MFSDITLAAFRAYCILKSESTKTYLSFLWWVIEPVILMSVYYVVFAVLLDFKTDDFIAFLLVGIIVFHWFSSAITHSANSINSSVAIVSNVRVRKEIFPWSMLLADLVKFLLVLIVLCGYLTVSGYSVTPLWLFLPVLVVLQFILHVGLGVLISGLVPFFPDTQHVISSLLRLVMYLSGIFYDINTLPEQYYRYFQFNPIAMLIEQYRSILIKNSMPSVDVLFWIFVFSVLMIIISHALIKRYETTYPRILLER